MGVTKVRYRDIRVADNRDDQSTPSQIALANTTSVTQEDLQALVLSQVKRIIFGENPGHWYLDFKALGIQPLSSIHRTGIQLTGTLDGINRTFMTPEKFVRANGISIDLFHNGRRLAEASTSDPRGGDFVVSESGGPGSGFDTVVLLTFSPVAGRSVILADYQTA